MNKTKSNSYIPTVEINEILKKILKKFSINPKESSGQEVKRRKVDMGQIENKIKVLDSNITSYIKYKRFQNSK